MTATPDMIEDLAELVEPYLEHTDTAAIHVDVADEITQITLKAAPLIDDVFVLEDTSDSADKKSATLGAMLKAPGQVSNLSSATPTIADSMAFEDDSDSDAMKKATVQVLLGTAGWVAGLTAKTTPVAADLLPVGDTADTDAIKKSTILQVTGAAALVSGLTAKATPIGADLIRIDDTASSNAAKKVTINSLPILQAQVVSVVSQPAADAAVEIDGTIGGLQLTVTGAGNVAISTNANCYAGQKVNLFAIAVAGGGSYTLALDVGTLTLNATSESAVVQRNAGNTAWVCVGLSSATIV